MSLVPSIIFEDTHLVVLSKPAGLLSQGEITGDENLVDWLRGHFGRNFVGLIHRLDRNTSGIMIVAKRSKAADRLTQQLQQGLLKRTYLALIEGRLESPARWAHRLLKNERTNKVEVIRPGSSQFEKAKDSALRVKPLGHASWHGLELTLAEFELETGRSHQIRAQSSHEGFPLLGDVKYGSSKTGAAFGRPALHSFELAFEHPMSKEKMRMQTPLPKDMASISIREKTN